MKYYCLPVRYNVKIKKAVGIDSRLYIYCLDAVFYRRISPARAFMVLYIAFFVVPLIMGAIASAFGMSVMMIIPSAVIFVSGFLGIALPKKELSK